VFFLIVVRGPDRLSKRFKARAENEKSTRTSMLDQLCIIILLIISYEKENLLELNAPRPA
jgi:hypothetical protein